MIENLVSTVIPVFNRAALLREAVASVLAQTHRPIEVIVVDDGSTDDTPEVAAAVADANPGVVRILRRGNGGPGAARETGRVAAHGEFVQYLDSDDLLLPRKFERQIAALRSAPDRGVAYGQTRFQPKDGPAAAEPWKGSGIPRETMFPSFLVERWWDTPTPLYRRSVCDRAGSWLALRCEEDWEYDCRIASFGTRLAYCPEFVAVVRDVSPDRLSKGSPVDPARARDRCRAHLAIAGHAKAAGLSPEEPAVRHFARALFLLARQCGAAGLSSESRKLLDAAGELAGENRTLDLGIYRLGASIVGWTAAGRLSVWMDGWRRTPR